MKKSLFLYFLFFSYSIKLVAQQQVSSVVLQYDTSGYVVPQTQNTVDLTLVPTVKGEMTVGESGALNYQLPIEVFRGVNNFQPNISLVYSSQSGNGQAGCGWNITGLSIISRGGQSKYIDGITIGAQFNDNDPFYLDGQRLIKNSNSNFQTEKFSKIKITKNTSGEYSFIIQYTDGKIAKYKELISGQNYISTIVDAFNNEIHYTYEIANNIPTVTKISYGGTDVSSDKFYIDFSYNPRHYNIKAFRNGQEYINTKVLSEIRTGSSYTGLFRKYAISYDLIEENSTERLRAVVVSNENGEILKPLSFNYNQSTSNSGSLDARQEGGAGFPSNTTNLYDATIGDFIGSGEASVTFISKNNSGQFSLTNTRYGGFNNVVNERTKLFSGRTLTSENKVSKYDQLVIVKTRTAYEDSYFEIVDTYTRATKRIYAPLYTDTPISEGSWVNTPPSFYYSQDFNNDGLIDVLCFYNYFDSNPNVPGLSGGVKLWFYEIGKEANSTSLTPIEFTGSVPSGFSDSTFFIEFDGDGVPELLYIDRNTNKYSIYKLDFLNHIITKILDQQELSNFGADTPLYFGDFNGDGLTDFLTPQHVYEIPSDDNDGKKLGNTYYSMQTDNLLWWKYTSNGQQFIKNQEDYTQQKIAYVKPSQNNFIKKSTFWQKFWNGKPDEYEYTRYSTHNIVVTDFNNDGRSDLILINKIGKAKYRSDGILQNIPVENLSSVLVRIQSNPMQLIPYVSEYANKLKLYENKNLQGGTFALFNTQSIESTTISPLSLILSNIDFNYLNSYKSSVYIHDPLLSKNNTFIINNDKFLEKQIQEVDNGSNVLQKVEYGNLNPSKDTKVATYIYKPDETLQYPFFTHQNNGSYYLVNKIHTLFDGKILTSEYRYENAIQNFEGKGFLGFQKTYASDSYESEIVNGLYRNKNPFKGVFWKIQTRDPLMDNATIISTYGGMNKFFSETKLVNKKYDKDNHQYLILSTDEVSKDFIKKITISKKYIYDENDNLKLKNAITDYNGIGKTSINYLYAPEFSNGQHYFYGKISSIESITTKGAETFSTKEETDYLPNGNALENRKFGNQANAPPIVTNYTYDNVGNILTQSLSTQGISTQTTAYEYESTKRFINKTITPDGLISTANINFLGRTTSEISSLGLTTSYTYDSWGNITEITDYLGKVTTISKSISTISGGAYDLHKKREGGVETIVTFDKFDREILAKNQSINGKWIDLKTEYDIYGRKIRSSLPFFDGETPKWNSTEYDELGRPVKNISYTGKIAITCYEGLKVTVDDGLKKASKTLDAMGNTIMAQDFGGIINYEYFPNGSLKKTNYEGIITSFEIDGWGNKTKIVDPSAGTFTYEYDNIGRITKETTPKGYTLYDYDNLGRPVSEKTYGNTPEENTNIEKFYTYNSNTKLPETINGTSNGKFFRYTTFYDQYYRITGKKEETIDFDYTSSTTFDSFGRADIVEIVTKIPSVNHTSSSSIKNIYDSNGILIQQDDNDSGNMVWRINSANAQGQTIQMEYGNGYVLTNEYDTSDLSLKLMKHQNSSNGKIALNIEYDYDVNKGVLNSRNNKVFDKYEEFTYDRLSRLLSESLNNTLTNEYTYDKRGRITSNTEVGKYGYNNTDYKLQNLAFNSNGQELNAQRGFADVKFNAYKSPLRIRLEGKDDLHFEYNILKTRYSMSSQVTGKQKFYSSDFAVEITKEGSNLEIVTYITGDPYSANYIKKEKIVNGNLESSANYFLHRDNIGSILAISKADGTIEEKRFFDAWGNLKGIINASGQNITDVVTLRHYQMFLDRGYTGHEHLQSVGLINMNARIYDPILRKFLSPDNKVSDPFNTQSYDRYGYVYNNPLLYVDIDGNEPITFGIAMLYIGIAAAVGVTTHAIMNMISGIPFWYGMGKAAVMGTISGAISLGIGSVATSMFSEALTFGKALFEAGMHVVTSGIMSEINGGTFTSGAWSGAISSLMASGVQALGNGGSDVYVNNQGYLDIGSFAERNPDLLKAMMVTSGGLSGGISSAIAGGNFWDGLKQGLITSGLNHVAHQMTGPGDDAKAKKLAKEYKSNEDRMVVESLVAETLLESTQVGEFTLKAVREKVLATYGDHDVQRLNEIYSTVGDVFKETSEQLVGKQLEFGKKIHTKFDVIKVKIAVGLGADVLSLQARNLFLEYRIKYLSKSVYYQYIRPPVLNSSFGGGGAKGSW